MSRDREDARRAEDSDDSDFSFAEMRDQLEDTVPDQSIDPPRAVEDEGSSDDGDSYFADLLSELSSRGDASEWDSIDERNEWEEGGLLSDPKSQAIVEILGDAKNVLVLGPLLCPADYEVCATLTGGGDGRPFNLLLVTFSQSPDDRLQVCHAYQTAAPGETQIIAVGSQTRSRSSRNIDGEGGTSSVDVVSNPSDLTRIGVKIDQTLNRWDETDRRNVLCFHSLSALLQFVDDERRVFRFLSILRGRVQKSDGHAHYHMEEGAHDESLVSLIRPLFDAVIRYDETGSVTVQS